MQTPNLKLTGDFQRAFRMRCPWPLKVATILLAIVSAAHAQTRSSASYTLTSETVASGAPRITGGATFSAADVTTGGSTVDVSTSASFTLKHGYIGQLTDPIVLNIRPASDPVDENTTVQMLGQVVVDDLSLVEVQGSDLSWAEIEGPIATLNGDGQATTGEVTTDTRATVLGSYQNVRTSVSFTVSDVAVVAPLLAARRQDSDGDGQSDFLESLAGFDPADATDFFESKIAAEGDGFVIELSRVVPDTRYVIETSTDLRIYRKVATLEPSELEEDVFVFDAHPFEPIRFYRIRMEPINLTE